MALLIMVLIICLIAAGAGLAMHVYRRNLRENARWEREEAPFWRTIGGGKPLRYEARHRGDKTNPTKENA